jgi:hypothetical protein
MLVFHPGANLAAACSRAAIWRAGMMMGMEEQKPDGSERRTAIFVAVALLLLAVPCLACMALVGMGAVMFYRLAESPPAVGIPSDIPVSPPLPVMTEPPMPIALPVQPSS